MWLPPPVIRFSPFSVIPSQKEYLPWAVPCDFRKKSIEGGFPVNGFYAKRVAALIVCLGFILGLFGCAATQVAIEKKDLDVQTKMSETIFLDPVAPEKRTIFVNIKNTSDKDLDIAADISYAIAARGYKVVQDPNLAHYMLQANVLSVGKTDPSALRETLVAGYGGPLMGAAVGAAATRSWGGAAAGGLIGGIAETVAGSLVKDVTFAIITDVQLSERSAVPVAQRIASNLSQGTQSTIQQQSSSTENWKRFRTRVVSSANKVNLKFEEAEPELRKGLAKSISGLF